MKEDLYRHYQLLDFIRGENLKSLFSGSFSNENLFIQESMNEYSGTSRIYLIYAWIISKFNNNAILPFVTSLIIYSNGLLICKDVDKKNKTNSFTIAIAMQFMLFCLDFKGFSGIRNMLAYSIMSAAIYLDLNKKCNKVFCVFLYIIACGIHTSVLMFVAFRILIIFHKFIPKWFYYAFALLIYPFVGTFMGILSRFTQKPIVSLILAKLNIYTGVSSADRIKLLLARLILMMIYFYIYYLYKKYGNKLLDHCYDYFVIMTLLFTVGAFNQYDFFMRTEQFSAMIVIPYVCILGKNIQGNQGVFVVGNSYVNGKNILIEYAPIFAGMMFSLLYFTRISYLDMGRYFLL